MVVILLAVAGALAGLTFGILKWGQSQHDRSYQTVSELRKEIRAGTEGVGQAGMQKALGIGDAVQESGRRYAEKTYGPLGTTTDEILSHENDQKEHVWPALLWRIEQKLDRRGWDHLSETERRLVAVDALEGEVNNGGFGQYFFNSTGNDADVALAGLRDIGAAQAAALLERAMAIFPGGRPPTDRQRRWAAMDKIKSLSDSVWSKCDSEFYHSKERLDELGLAYVKQNKAEVTLAPVQELIRSCSWKESVVPLGQGGMFEKVQLLHLLL